MFEFAVGVHLSNLVVTRVTDRVNASGLFCYVYFHIPVDLGKYFRQRPHQCHLVSGEHGYSWFIASAQVHSEDKASLRVQGTNYRRRCLCLVTQRRLCLRYGVGYWEADTQVRVLPKSLYLLTRRLNLQIC